MTNNVLILGASGRFGRHAAQAFERSGWKVTAFDRRRDDLNTAVRAADFVVNAWNPGDYSVWARDLMPMHQQVIDALRGTDIPVLIPGNVYVFGASTPLPWSEHSPHAAENPLGRLRIEMEEAYRAAGIRTIILRAGDFLDTEASGNWFDLMLVKKLHKGVLTYPGALDAPHAWGYLPDLARVAEALARKHADLPRFADIPFPGYTMTAEDMAATLAQVLGRPVRAKRMAWWPIRLIAPVAPAMRGLVEMSYLWSTPHRLDGTRLNDILPHFQPTDSVAALSRAVAHLPLAAREGSSRTIAA